MVLERKMTRTAIETALNKGFRDIDENLHRGVRYLADLGTHFAKGRFQKDFFHLAQQVLQNENSTYYDIIADMVHNTDRQIIKTLGLNLGYNSWTYGAEKIRKLEKIYGHNIPWNLVFDFRRQTETALSPAEVSGILDNGEKIGIYCSMFFLSPDASFASSLLSVLARHKDHVFFVFVPPATISDPIAQAIAQAKNITPVLEMTTGENSEPCGKAARILRTMKCLYGAYCVYGNENLEFIMSQEFAGQVEALGCTFAFLLREKREPLQREEQFSQFIKDSKSLNKNRFFLIDFYSDLAYVGRTISDEDCFLAIKADGTIAVASMDKGWQEQEQNIKTASFLDILHKVMPSGRQSIVPSPLPNL